MIRTVLTIAREAGECILEHYERSPAFRLKADQSPVTAADEASSQLLCERLAALGFPVLSEEAEVDYSVRRTWETFWLVDPLDGTKEFLKRNGEFTVNIALIDQARPVFGVVYAPALDQMAWAVLGNGAFLESPEGPLRLDCRTAEASVGLASRSHSTAGVEAFYRRNGIQTLDAVGSALKFIKVARGEAGLYARFSGSKEWDTAAGQLLVTEAGGWVRPQNGRAPLLYNKEDLENGNFVAGSGNVDPGNLEWPDEDGLKR